MLSKAITDPIIVCCYVTSQTRVVSKLTVVCASNVYLLRRESIPVVGACWMPVFAG